MVLGRVLHVSAMLASFNISSGCLSAKGREVTAGFGDLASCPAKCPLHIAYQDSGAWDQIVGYPGLEEYKPRHSDRLARSFRLLLGVESLDPARGHHGRYALRKLPEDIEGLDRRRLHQEGQQAAGQLDELDAGRAIGVCRRAELLTS